MEEVKLRGLATGDKATKDVFRSITLAVLVLIAPRRGTVVMGTDSES